MPRKKKTITKGGTTINVNVKVGDGKQRKRRPRRNATRKAKGGQTSYGAIAPATFYHGDANLPGAIGTAISRAQEQQQQWYSRQVPPTQQLFLPAPEKRPMITDGGDILDLRQSKIESSVAQPEMPQLIAPVDLPRLMYNPQGFTVEEPPTRQSTPAVSKNIYQYPAEEEEFGDMYGETSGIRAPPTASLSTMTTPVKSIRGEADIAGAMKTIEALKTTPRPMASPRAEFDVEKEMQKIIQDIPKPDIGGMKAKPTVSMAAPTVKPEPIVKPTTAVPEKRIRRAPIEKNVVEAFRSANPEWNNRGDAFIKERIYESVVDWSGGEPNDTNVRKWVKTFFAEQEDKRFIRGSEEAKAFMSGVRSGKGKMA